MDFLGAVATAFVVLTVLSMVGAAMRWLGRKIGVKINDD